MKRETATIIGIPTVISSPLNSVNLYFEFSKKI